MGLGYHDCLGISILEECIIHQRKFINDDVGTGCNLAPVRIDEPVVIMNEYLLVIHAVELGDLTVVEIH